MAAGVRGLDFLLMERAELGEGVHGIVGAVAAKTLVFTVVKNLNLGRAIGLGKNFRFGFSGFKRYFGFGRIFKPTARTHQLISRLCKSVVDSFSFKQGVGPAIPANDFYCTHQKICIFIGVIQQAAKRGSNA
ncbi:MAG: hypothetical protein ABFS02_06795 [Pseudomonadota bacterium]